MYKLTSITLASIMLLSEPPLFGEDAAPEPSATNRTNIDPQAEQILRQSARLISDARTLSVQVHSVVRTEAPGYREENRADVLIALQRPDKLVIEQKEGIGRFNVVSDGEKLFMYMPGWPRYVEMAAPDTLEDLMTDDNYAVLRGHAGAGAVFDMLIAKDAYSVLTEDMQAVTFIGKEELDDKPHHRLRLVGLETIDVWIADGEQPLIRRIVPDASHQLEQVVEFYPQLKGMKIDSTIDFFDWAIDRPVAADRFVIEPPPGVERVGSFEELGGAVLPGGGGEADSPE